ncbi:dihydroxyacetone phosphate acyltransferase isoform X3 [Hydra vulgaris]|uniref:Dihydroxyacetone phosphate acyltransferase isoform X3 n=1 Tax=Hydra vulgaris TaxID=6087 RepID=A0ABM4CHV0_HYDVU
MSNNKNGWVDVTISNQWDIFWSLFHNHKSPTYMFAEKYDRSLIKDKILSTHRIKDVIEKHKQETGIDSNTAYKNAASIIDEISHAFSLRTIRFMAYIIMKTVKKLFKEVLVNKDGIDAFRECSYLTPVVLAPTHNSYFDFILISYVCFAMNLPIPAIAAGQDFLSMAIVNHLLRGSGAFYMRRSFATDFFYKSIFTEYVQLVLLIAERPIEFFPEGTRSRCGKAFQPKVGLLSMVLESFVHGFVPDVSFIPISISFEKITEENLYMFELLGIPKPKESLLGMLKARSVLYSDYGSVCIYFGKIMSLKDFCNGKIDNISYVKIPRCERHLKIFGREESEMKIAKDFAIQIVLEQQSNMTIYIRAVVAAYLLQYQNVELEALVQFVNCIGFVLSQFGCRLYSIEELITDKSSIVKALNYSCMVLKITDNKVIYDCFQLSSATSIQNDLSKVLIDLECHALGYVYLSCQRNRLIQSCFFPSILLCSMSRSLHRVACFKIFSFLSDLLQFEVIINPTCNNEEAFVSAINLLQTSKLVIITNDEIIPIKIKMAEIEFLIYLLQPFYDAYLIVMENLLVQKFNFPISFKLIAASLQLHSVNTIKYCGLQTYESLSLHTLSNIVIYLSRSDHLLTVKNAKFETLISGVNRNKMIRTMHELAKYVSPCLKNLTNESKL